MTLLAALAILVAASLTVMLSRVVTLDDAYITFRYARHLADGYGLGAWNRTGEHVEGYSSLLWMLLLAGAARFGVDVWVASKALGVGAAIAVIATLIQLRRRIPVHGGRRPHRCAWTEHPVHRAAWHVRPGGAAGFQNRHALGCGAAPGHHRRVSVGLGARRRKMILEMVSSPRFQREYVFVRNAPYDRLDRAVFLRRDFWEGHPRRDTLDCVSVADTSLAAFADR